MKLYLVLLPLILGSISAQNADDPDWWKHSVVYQIYPRSFKDSNNDGIGDLQGIISKLEHLKDIGVTMAWLSPIFASPQVDQGYDISNFTDIHYEYGTLEDFDQLVAKANELGLKVVLDFVPNHSSNKHIWFEKSENREPGYENYYVWRDAKPDGSAPTNWLSVFKYSAWEWSEKRQQYYLHQFAKEMPDLNYNDPKLVQEMKDAMTFWLDRGISGFRIDAISHLFEDPNFPDEPLGDPNAPSYDYSHLNHIYTKEQPQTFDMVYQWRDLVDEYAAANGKNTIVLMTEAMAGLDLIPLYYENGDRKGAHFSFNFNLLNNLNTFSNAYDVVNAITAWMDIMGTNLTPNWVLGNHDQTRAATKYGTENVDGMNMLASLLPGVQVTYNGEEIGMENGEVTWEEGQDPSACNGSPEDFPNVSRDFQRTPFHWDNTTNAGFNEGAKTWLPVSSKYLSNNLALQKTQQKTHYSVYKKLMELRNTDVLTFGKFEIHPYNDQVIVIYRKVDGYPGYVLLYNKSAWAANIDVKSTLSGLTDKLSVVLTNVQSARAEGEILTSSLVVLDANEAVIALEVL